VLSAGGIIVPPDGYFTAVKSILDEEGILLIVDEVGYLPLAQEAAAALFQVISQRYLKGSVCLTTNLGVGSWGKIFNDDPTVAAAMLDRLLHRSVVFNINGESYRMRAHRARVENLRKGVNAATKA